MHIDFFILLLSNFNLIKMKIGFLLTLWIFSSAIVNAQSKREKELAAIVETFKAALVSGDRIQLENIASEKLSYGHSSGKIEDKAAFVEALASGKSDFIKINLSDQTISITGNTALVRHKLLAETNDNGKTDTKSLGVLLVFQKEKGTWKLLVRQAFKL